MPVTCDPAALARAASCYCYDQKVEAAVTIYLLAQLAEDTSTPAELAAKAKCFCYGDKSISDSVIAYLLCEIATAVGA